jgi:hypothetical protein
MYQCENRHVAAPAKLMTLGPASPHLLSVRAVQTLWPDHPNPQGKLLVSCLYV